LYHVCPAYDEREQINLLINEDAAGSESLKSGISTDFYVFIP